jgi:hypothetical protein
MGVPVEFHIQTGERRSQRILQCFLRRPTLLIGGKRRSPLATRKTCLDIVVSPSTDCRLAITKVNRWRQAQVFCHIVESFHNKKFRWPVSAPLALEQAVKVSWIKDSPTAASR